MLVEWPFYWSLDLIAFLSTGTFRFGQVLRGVDYQSRVTIIDKETAKVTVVPFVLPIKAPREIIGAYEDTDGSLVLDIASPVSPFIGALSEPLDIRRYVIPLLDTANSTARTILVGSSGLEKPTRNPDYIGREYRYSYGVSPQRGCIQRNTIIKVDFETGIIKRWQESNVVVSQPVFVPNPERASEDQGVLMPRLCPKWRELICLHLFPILRS